MLGHLPKKRRQVLRGLVGAGVTFFAAPFVYAVGKYLSFNKTVGDPNATVKLNAADLTPSSPFKLVDLNDEPIIVVRESDNVIRAFSATCTHLGCTVTYLPKQPGFYCKCHGGKYYENGVNVPGTRPKAPLTPLTLNQQGDDLEVSLKPLKA